MPDGLAAHYLDDAMRQFHSLKALAEGALGQIDEHDLFTTLDEDANSIAVLLKHMAGSLRARWAGFPATVEDSQDRDRDSEFIVAEEDTKEVLIERWEAGWRYLFTALTPLTPEDITKTVHIRGKPLSVLEAINRQLTHYAYHVGQIVFLAKHFRSSAWQSLSIPRGKSDEFTAAVSQRPEA
jgi:Protein of unknown function (DUF1572)